MKQVVCNIGGLYLMYLIVGYNMGNIGASQQYQVAPSLRWTIWALETEQYWGVFAPRPPDSYWWYNIQGTLDNETVVELWGQAGLFTWEPNPASWDKPDPLYISFKNHRWFKYFENGLNTHPANEQIRLNFGRWVCREYNARHGGDERLLKFEMWLMNERLDLAKMDGSRIFTGKRSLWNHMCYYK